MRLFGFGNFEPGAGTVTCFCEFSGQKRPEPGWRNLEWACDETRIHPRPQHLYQPRSRDKNWHVQETMAETMLVNLKYWAWTMNKVLSHSSEIETLLSVLCTRRHLCGCLWLGLRVSSPFWNPEIGLNSSKKCLGLRDFPPPCYTQTCINLDIYIMIYIVYGVFHAWATADLLRMNCWVSIPNYPKLLT